MRREGSGACGGCFACAGGGGPICVGSLSTRGYELSISTRFLLVVQKIMEQAPS